MKNVKKLPLRIQIQTNLKSGYCAIEPKYAGNGSCIKWRSGCTNPPDSNNMEWGHWNHDCSIIGL